MAKYKLLYLIAMMALLVSCIRINLTENLSQDKLIKVALVTNPATIYLPTPDETPAPANQITPTEPTPAVTLTILYTPTQTGKSPEPTGTEVVSTPTQTQVETKDPQDLSASVKLDANCRTGPGIVYDVIGYINHDDKVQVIGRNLDNSWFLIIRSESLSQCWAADQVIELDGYPDNLPTIAAPPTPTPRPSPTSTLTKEPRNPNPPYAPPGNATATVAPPYP